jgi:hypothetical protein
MNKLNYYINYYINYYMNYYILGGPDAYWRALARVLRVLQKEAGGGGL